LGEGGIRIAVGLVPADPVARIVRRFLGGHGRPS
jgi:hypothetical protein